MHGFLLCGVTEPPRRSPIQRAMAREVQKQRDEMAAELDQHVEDILKRANENQNARSPAPTLIDDSSSESELRSRSPLGCRRSRMQSIPIPSGMHLNVPDCVLPYLRWSNMASRIQQCLDYSRDDHRIEYMLAPPDSDPQSWIDKVLNYGLHVVRGKDVCFKIGISYWPATRFNYEDYRRLPLMVLSLVSEQCDFIAKQETDALKRYRKLDREGHVVNDLGDDRCMNRAPGGESHGHGYFPHFCYCVFGQRSKFKKRK